MIVFYILLCRNGRYYIGSTNDLDRRIEQHKSGYVKSTKYVLPIELIAMIPCQTLTEARILERKIKKGKSRIVVEKYIEQYYVING